MTEKKMAQPAWIVLALCLYVFAFQGSRGLWERDEGRYTNVALMMLRTADWVVPRMNGEQVHLSKPPLTYWTIASGVRLLGRNEWAVRLPCAAAFLVTIVLVWTIAQRLCPGREWTAGAVYATSLLPFGAANTVTTDTLLTLWETLAVGGFVAFHWSDGSERRAPLWRVAMGTGFGLAFLTRGPPGLLPLLAIIVFVVSTRGFKGLTRLLSSTGLLLFLVAGFGWFVALICQDRERLGFFVREEFLNRIFSGEHRRNSALLDGLMYVPILLIGLLPWSALVFRGSREKTRGLWSLRNRATRLDRPEAWFLALWVLIPLIVFTLSQSRLPFYVLPLCVPLSIALARIVPSSAIGNRDYRRLLAVWAVGLVALKGAAALAPSERDDRATAAAVRQQVEGPIAEVVFVDNRAYYGLSFYLDCDVKSVAFSRDDRHFGPAYHNAASALVEDLVDSPEGEILDKVYLVRPSKEDEFREVLQSEGFDAVALGEAARFVVCRVRNRAEP
ncbi:glycosyltransferase family 39 protein [Candidatus Sumerlaeota bacterium]|nr:glycosyltransferase family 39 protein [Candidatus Sumerlaeota bacterium]